MIYDLGGLRILPGGNAHLRIIHEALCYGKASQCLQLGFAIQSLWIKF